MAHELNVERREGAGKGASRRLRHTGKIPAIVYGGGLEPVAIQLVHEDIWLAQQNEWFYSSILDLNLGGDIQQVLLRDMQRHPARPRVLHLDFQRVMANEVLRLSVPLRFVNQETSPAGKTSGVVIMHELTEVEIECLPADLPSNIEVDLAALKEGDVVHLSALILPKGVSIPSLKLGADHDVAVVIARQLAAEAEVDTAAPAAAEVPATKAKAPEAAKAPPKK
jgi:large subunit ribosomal protein L25